MARYHHVAAAPPPPASARYAHAVEANGFLFVTGQLPVDPDRPEADPPEGIVAQTELVIRNLAIIAAATGYRLEDTVCARIYLARFDADYAGMNAVFHRHFHDPEKLPARTTVGVARLGRNALVEIDLILARA